MVKIKKATLKDLKDILNFNQQLFDYEYKNFDRTLDCDWPKNNEKYFKKRIIGNNSLALTIFENNKIIGYLIGNITKAEDYRKIKKIAEIEDMFILPKFRRKGIGGLLCEKFLEWAKKKGIKRAKVVASAKNKGAVSCYKKAGFSDYNLILEKELKWFQKNM